MILALALAVACGGAPSKAQAVRAWQPSRDTFMVDSAVTPKPWPPGLGRMLSAEMATLPAPSAHSGNVKLSVRADTCPCAKAKEPVNRTAARRPHYRPVSAHAAGGGLLSNRTGGALAQARHEAAQTRTLTMGGRAAAGAAAPGRTPSDGRPSWLRRHAPGIVLGAVAAFVACELAHDDVRYVPAWREERADHGCGGRR
jgi:hypothetical protein